MDGILVLEDGHFFRGKRFGGEFGAMGGHGAGEVVFNTSLTGYQEILTDPSYEGQIVTLTYPHIGNYGVNPEDSESSGLRAAGLICRDYHPVPSNWRSDRSLGDYLAAANVPALCGVDTRRLVLLIRDVGALRGVIRPFADGDNLPIAGRVRVDSDAPDLLDDPRVALLAREAQVHPSMAGLDLASRVTCKRPWTLGPEHAKKHVVAMDFGIKLNIVHQLVALGCRVTVVPATTTAIEILALRPDGVLLSNGPGDPEPVAYAVETIRYLLGKVPIFGICLGHQLLGIACGGKTYKLGFGHRGGNHPVRDLDTGRVEITAQNHGFAVAASSLNGREVVVTHTNLNDDTVEGLRHKRWPAFSVQFHPEASPGPHDSHHLFKRFAELMDRPAQPGYKS